MRLLFSTVLHGFMLIAIIGKARAIWSELRCTTSSTQGE